MQPMKYLQQWLQKNTSKNNYLFLFSELRALLPGISDSAFKTLLSRAVRAEVLERVCRGMYLFKAAYTADGLLLFHVAAKLRGNEFNYISLEKALSDLGIISQIPVNWISIMSSGRSYTVSCGKYGTIEFVHNSRKPAEVMSQLAYDTDCGLWRASAKLAIADMKKTNRNSDLIDWDIANEFI